MVCPDFCLNPQDQIGRGGDFPSQQSWLLRAATNLDLPGGRGGGKSRDRKKTSVLFSPHAELK